MGGIAERFSKSRCGGEGLMNEQFDFEYIRFEWDSNKNTSNQTKHGLAFEVAIYAFFDNNGFSEKHQIVDGEQRWRTVGMIEGCVVVL